MINQTLEKMINKEVIHEIAIEAGFMKRERKVSALNLLLSLVFR